MVLQGDQNVGTEVYGMIGQRGPAGWHRALYPMFCDHPHGNTSEEE